jgi:predicted amidophosphoribosyltransferase
VLGNVVAVDRCPVCGAFGGPLCGRCRRALVPSAERCFRLGDVRVLTALDYSGAARALVLALKLSGRRAAAQALVESMADVVGREGMGATVLTWVPGRPGDTRHKGFDHARLLAEGLSLLLGLPLVRLLERSRTGSDQSGLGREERWVNVRETFVSRTTRARVAVVDDLVTSGATASAVASALTRGGAAGVEVVAACRAAAAASRP